MTIKKKLKQKAGRIVWRASLLVLSCTLLLLPRVSAAETLTPTINTALSTDITSCLTLTVTNTQGASCGSVTYDSYDTITLVADYDIDNLDVSTTTLTITPKNNRDVDIVYTVDSGEEQSTTIPASGSLEISVTANSNGTAQTKVICIDSVKEDSAVYVPTFAANPNGSYTVGEKVITSDYTPEEAIEGSYKLTPGEAADGYEFFGWYGSVNGAYTANADGSLDYLSGTVETVYALFVPTDCATYTVGSKQYAYLDHAITGTNGSGQITVTSSGKVYHSEGEKTFNIPANVDLLVPFGSGDTGTFSETPGSTNFGADYTYLAPIYNAPTATANSVTYETLAYSHAYCTLTVPTDTVINLSGRMNVNSQIHSNGARDTGCPHGPYGLVVLEHGAQLNILSGGTLYCYGWIMGTFNSKNEYTGGQVVANAGANVFENFQIRDWRGGTATTKWMNQSTLSFPISQYYIQNIEAEYIIHTNANSNIVFSTSSGGSISTLTAKAVGSGDDCLFKLTAGYIIRTYDPTTERIAYRLCKDGATVGNMALSSIKLTLAGEEINSANYILPLNSNMTITIGNGCSASITYKVKLLPGAQLIVEKGATVTVPSTGALYIYDKSDWNASYTFWASSNAFQDVGNEGTTINDNRNTQRMVVRYSPSRAVIYGASTAVTSRTYGSAQVRVDGILIANGNVFTTAGYMTGTTSSSTLGGSYLTAFTQKADAANIDKALVGTGTFENKAAFSTNTYYYYKKDTYAAWSVISTSGTWYTSKPSDTYSKWIGAGDKFSKVGSDFTTYGELDEYYNSAVRVMINCLPVVGLMATSADTVPTTYSNFGASTYYGTYYDKDSDGVEESGEFFWYQTPNTTVNMLDKASGSTVDTWTTFFFSGTTPSGYYTDAACTTTGVASTMYTLAEAYIVRTDGTEYYQTVNKAIKDSCSDETVYIIRDLTLSEGIVVPYDKNVILDLNGKTVSYAGTVLTNKGTLTLQNGTLSNTKTDGDAYTGSAIRNIDTIDSIGGTITINTATASAGSAILNHGGKIGTIGGAGSNVTIDAACIGIQTMGSGSRITTVGGEDSTVTINNATTGIQVTDAGASIDTIGADGAVVTINTGASTTGSGILNSSGTIGTIGGAGSNVTIDAAYYGIQQTGSGATISVIGGDADTAENGAKVTVNAYNYHTLYVNTGTTIGTIGGKYSDVTFTLTTAKSSVRCVLIKGTVNLVGGTNAKVKVEHNYTNTTGAIHMFRVEGGTVGTIGGDNAIVQLIQNSKSSQDGYGLILGSGGKVGIIGGSNVNAVEIIVQDYPIYVASDCEITEIAEGTLFVGKDNSTYGVLNQYKDENGTIGKISGGYYGRVSTTDINKSIPVYYRPSIIDGYTLSQTTKSVTSYDGDSYNCYYLVQHTHSYTAAFDWADDHSSCTVTATCSGCVTGTRNKTLTGEATVTSATTDATCTVDGKTVYTATVTLNGTEYSDTYTETITATGHSEVTVGAAAPTCTVQGYTGDTKCTVCGTVLTPGKDIPATGHSYGDEVTYIWTDYTSCTASRTCTVCAEETKGHTETANAASITSEVTTAATCTTEGVRTYTATFDVDWATDQTTEEILPIDSAAHTYDASGACTGCDWFKFYGANVTLGNNLDMMFAFSRTAVEDWTGCYVKAVRTYADGSTSSVTYNLTDWTTSGGYYVVTYTGFAAKEMCDTIILTVYNADGEAMCDSWTDSMRGYAMRMLKKAEDGGLNNLKTVIVDMLNYGAAAQTRFSYGTSDLANAKLTETQQGYGSEDFDDKNVADTISHGTLFSASNLTLESNIYFTMAISGLSTGGYAMVSYTDHFGNAVSERAEIKQDSTSGLWLVEIPKLVVADARQVVTVEIYKAATDESSADELFTTCKDSVEAYLARLIVKAEPEDETERAEEEAQRTIVKAFMTFADSAKVYLHNRNG